jgi:hypothetical protein
LASLDSRYGMECPACEALLLNTGLHHYGGFAVGGLCGAAAFAALVWLGLDLGVFGFLPLFVGLAFLGHIAFAKPTIYVPTPWLCAECGRDDVGYLSPGDTVCAECRDRLEHERVARLHERRRG